MLHPLAPTVTAVDWSFRPDPARRRRLIQLLLAENPPGDAKSPAEDEAA